MNTPSLQRGQKCAKCEHLSVPIGRDGKRRVRITWAVLGGESGNAARPLEVPHLRSLLRQCQRSGTPVFVKQLGYRFMDLDNVVYGAGIPATAPARQLKQRAGADMNEWPEDLRVREWPVLSTDRRCVSEQNQTLRPALCHSCAGDGPVRHSAKAHQGEAGRSCPIALRRPAR